VNAKILASLLLRLFGVFLIIEGAASAISASARLIEPSEWRTEIAMHGSLALVDLIAGIVVLRSADRIAARLVRDLEVGETTGDAARFHKIAFAIAGWYFLVTGLAQLTGIGYTMWARPKWDETRTLEYLWDHAQVHLGTAIGYSLGGAILLLSRDGLSRSIARAWRVVRDRQT
jgi:hypothetical protein